MGTSGIFGVRINGVDKLTYNHFDSYPDKPGLGNQLVEIIRETIAPDIDNFKKLATAIELIDTDIPPTPEQIKKYAEFTDLSVSGQSTSDWYCVLRNLQENILGIFQAGVIIDSHKFVNDSLFCEFGYIINFDTNIFEAYMGFQHKPDQNKNNRYRSETPTDSENIGEDNRYYPIALVGEFPLQEIPEDWIAQAYPQENEDE